MIKNVILDFGGILIHIEYERTLDAFSELFNRPIHFKDLPKEQLSVFTDYEKGLMNTETFLWNLQHHFDKSASPRDLIDAWNAMLIGIPKKSFDFLEALRARNYKIFLMSNTNELHMQWVYTHLKKEHQITDFDDRYFDKTYYSHHMHLRKPDAKIFTQILEEHKLKANETLFIDDIAENLVPLKEIGIRGHLFPRNTNLNVLFQVFENFS